MADDNLTHEHIVELHRKVDLLVKMLARQQDQISKISKSRSSDPNYRSRRYLRSLLKKLREEKAVDRAYITQLENELRLHGLE